ncbi:phosphatase PAP2 family protein, partial [Nocardioides sp.]|uniref:phosphatase PAP2 family protein n=1 Tax=Nocardioides sp. TaxID=35761 RepID=UPI0027330A26
MSVMTTGDARTDRATGTSRSRIVPALRRGGIEAGLLVALYAVYSASRLLADGDPTAALERADWLLGTERALGLAWESSVVEWVADNTRVGLAASYFYATAHYVVTAGVLLWLYRRGPAVYRPARRTLLLATGIALIGYLLVPMAPPRLAGHTDVLRLHSAD